MVDSLEERTRALFLSAPYPGKQKFVGQPTGLLYALSVLAERKERRDSKEGVAEEIAVWCPDGVDDFSSSGLRKELTGFLEQEQPRIVGISTFTASYQNALEIMKLVKERDPTTIVIFGGANEDNSVTHYRTSGRVDADFVIAGDGPLLLDELYQLIEEHPGLGVKDIKERVLTERARFERLSGAGLLLFNTKVREAGVAGLEEVATQAHIESTKRKALQLDQLPILPRYLLRREDALSRWAIFDRKKTAQVMVGQGCPYGCGFCSEGIKRVWFGDDSPRSVLSARALPHLGRELQQLKKEGYEAIFFDDSTFFAKPRRYMRSVIGLLKEQGFVWGCQTTLGSIHQMRELLPEMRASGLQYLYMGFEHSDEKIRDSFGKDIGGGDKFRGYSVEETLDLLAAQGISTGISLTFGHPDPTAPDERTRETEQTARQAIEQTARLLQCYSNIVGVSLNLVTYHPGTPDSVRYEAKVGPLDYTVLPNLRSPFTEFEEGMGLHPKGMTDKLAAYIVKEAQEKIDTKLIF